MKRVLKNIIFTAYVILAIFITICLLSYDNYGTTVFGNYALVIITSDDIEEYSKGDLVIIDNENLEIENGENVFFYDIKSSSVEISYGEITSYEVVTSTETTYEIEDDVTISSEYIIGSDKDATVISHVGTILSVLESKWGFLFLVVLPILIAFLYEVVIVISEIRNPEEEDDDEKDDNKDKKKDNSKNKDKN